MIYNQDQIKEIIPHRYEMLLLSRVTELEEKRIVAQLDVSADIWFFKGHFPTEPVMPGVLMVEASAQAAAVLYLGQEKNKGKIGYFGGINSCKFKNKVLPGDTLVLEVEELKSKGPVVICKAVGKNQNGKKVFVAEISLIVG